MAIENGSKGSTRNAPTSTKKGDNVMSTQKTTTQDAAINAKFAAMRRAKRDAVALYDGSTAVRATVGRVLEHTAYRAPLDSTVNSRADYNAANDFAALIRDGGADFSKKLMDEYSERPAYLSAKLWTRWQSQYRARIMSGVVSISGNVVTIADLPMRAGKFYLELPMTPDLYCRLVTKGDMFRALEYGGAWGNTDSSMRSFGAIGERMPHVVTVYRLAGLIRKAHAAIIKAQDALAADDSDARAATKLAALTTDLDTYERGFVVAWARATAASAQYSAQALVARHNETIGALASEIDSTRNEDALAALKTALAAVIAERDAALAIVASSGAVEDAEDAAVLADNASKLEDVQNAGKLEDVTA